MAGDCIECKNWEEDTYWSRFRTFHFCQFLSDGFDQYLAIPKKFSSSLKEKILGTVILRGPSGLTWDVELVTEGDTLILKHGWKQFVGHHSLEKGDILIFKYSGNSRFDVLVFDQASQCEKVAPDFAKNSEHAESRLVKKQNERVEKDSVITNPSSDAAAHHHSTVKLETGAKETPPVAIRPPEFTTMRSGPTDESGPKQGGSLENGFDNTNHADYHTAKKPKIEATETSPSSIHPQFAARDQIGTQRLASSSSKKQARDTQKKKMESTKYTPKLPFDKTKFASMVAQDLFYELFKHRPLIKMRNYAYKGSWMEDTIKFQNWERLAAGWKNASSLMVKEFYANLGEIATDETLDESIFIRNKHYQWTPAEIDSLLGRPQLSCDAYAEMVRDTSLDAIFKKITVESSYGYWHTFEAVKRLHVRHLKPHLKLWNKFFCTNILPNNHNTDFDLPRAQMLYAIEEKIYIPVSSIIEENIWKAQRKRLVDGLPYGSLITAFMIQNKIKIEGEVDLPLLLEMKKAEIEKAVEENEEHLPPPQSPPHPHPHPPLSLSFEEKVDLLTAQVQELQTDFHAFQQWMRSHFQTQ